MIPFTDDEKHTIARLSIPGGWDHVDSGPIKAKIKPFLLAKTSSCCCYCRRSMHLWHGMTIDIEHVLPKGNGKYPQFMFEPKNLSVACKRCNMGIKRGDTSFYHGAPGEPNPFKSEHYAFIHPNLDIANNHLAILFVQHNDKLMVKYQVINGSAKGTKAYEYFELQKLEVNSFAEADGLDEVEPSDTLPPEFAIELKTILDTNGPNI